MISWDDVASFATPVRHRSYRARRLKLRGSAQALTLIGDGPCLEGALSKLGLEIDEETGASPVGVFGLRKRISEAARAGDLVLARIPRRLPLGTRGSPLGPRSPEFIGAVAPVADIMQRVRVRKDNECRAAARIVRQRGLRRVETRDEDAFERFYHDFYTPFITSRFGERRLLRSSEALARRLRHGCVQFTVDGDERLTGSLLEQGDGMIRKLVFGSPLPIERIRVQRLDAVAKYHAAMFAAQQGCPSLDFGASDPFASDGILRKKLFWRARLHAQRFCRWDMLACWSEDGPLVRRYLAAAPVVRNDQGGFDILVGDDTSLPTCTFEDRRICRVRHVGDRPHSLTNSKNWPVEPLGWQMSARI